MASDALTDAGGVALSLGMGVLSALVPVVNAEVYAVAVSLKAAPVVALLCALALAVGQTGGKWVWFTSGRKGAEVHARRRRSRTTQEQRAEQAAGERRLLDRLAERLRDRRSSAALVLVSGSVGVPPLALVSVAAGANRMRTRDFLVCCLLGRAARFSVVLVPLALRS